MTPNRFELVTSLRYDPQLLSLTGTSFYMPRLHRTRLAEGVQKLRWDLRDDYNDQDWLETDAAFCHFLSREVHRWNADQLDANAVPLKVRIQPVDMLRAAPISLERV